MKNRIFPPQNLPIATSAEWLLGLVLAVVNIHILDYIFRLAYPSEIDDMGLAVIQQVRMKVILLGAFIILISTIIDIVGIVGNTQGANSAEESDDLRRSNLSFDLTVRRGKVPKFLDLLLVVIEKTCIISLMVYLIQNSFAALIGTMDFLLSGPLPSIYLAYTLLTVNCFLIFCLFVFLSRFRYKWRKLESKKYFGECLNARLTSPAMMFFVLLLLRSLYITLLIIVINLLTTFVGGFFILVGILTKISLLLGLWTGICLVIILYMRSRLKSLLLSETGENQI